ncbi:MAG: exodeoxyribonuclease III [Betaproteobacteria bacterium]|jgi:exodeoxyribonuclease III|nr:exodeoxyribonuclease III [Betaproteobacteria bacterium]NBT11197.1 exodeoxyribonuclease III [Betaproteobacteria bacterium]NBU49574.1 exodeoxyribonuclease III [Betaproteobacteria bacterium]
MKLATWNVNSLSVRLPHLLTWLKAHPVDALVLQETKLTDDKFPQAELAEAGWQAVWFGQKTYNGVALLVPATQAAPADVVRNIPGFGDDQARVVTATIHTRDSASSAEPPAPTSSRTGLRANEPIRVIGAYFPNGQAPGSDKFAYKMRWLQALHDWVRTELLHHPRLVLMGDFNIAPEDRDVHDPIAWAGQIHCTDEERAHFRALLALGLHDAFRLFDQAPKSWSWWDYRHLAFRKNQGLRIDHILVSQALRAGVTACCIDKEARRAERPSDHAPVVLTLDS